MTQLQADSVAAVHIKYRLRSNNSSSTNLFECNGLRSLTFNADFKNDRTPEFEIETKCCHEMRLRWPLSRCKEVIIIDIHYRTRNVIKRESIRVGCSCSQRDSKQIKPVPDEVSK